MTSLQSLRNFRAHNAGRRISFVSGNFKVIHPGHIRLLRFAREMADRLVVGVVPGNPWNAMVSERDRLENVNALKFGSATFPATLYIGPLELIMPDAPAESAK